MIWVIGITLALNGWQLARCAAALERLADVSEQQDKRAQREELHMTWPPRKGKAPE